MNFLFLFTIMLTPCDLWCVYLQGKPRPVVTWFKDGIPLDDRTVGIRTGELDTILFIRSAERTHSGKYTLSVQIENMLDSADIHIQIVGWSCRAPLSFTSNHQDTHTPITGSLSKIRTLRTGSHFTKLITFLVGDDGLSPTSVTCQDFFFFLI